MEPDLSTSVLRAGCPPAVVPSSRGDIALVASLGILTLPSTSNPLASPRLVLVGGTSSSPEPSPAGCCVCL